MSNTFVVCMGIGTVFIGLICIVILCKIMSLICIATEGKRSDTKAAVAPVAAAPAVSAAIENRQEIIAAVTAAVCEDMGTDISAVRVLSFRKV